MKDVRDLKDLTIHDVQPIGDEKLQDGGKTNMATIDGGHVLPSVKAL